MPLIQIETPFNIDLEFEIAEVYKRLLAYLIDFCILLLFFVSMKYLYYSTFSFSDTRYLESHMGIDILTISLPMLLYSLVCEVSMHGQTFGKKALHIRVISLNGGEPSLGEYIIRWMFKAFEWPFFFGYAFFSLSSLLGYIFITGFWGVVVLIILAISKKNQRFGDLAANTVVVNTRSLFSVNDTIFMDISPADYKVMFPEVLRLSDRDVNTIKSVLTLYHKERNTHTASRLVQRIKEVLQIQTDMNEIDFLETLLADYNYLATR